MPDESIELFKSIFHEAHVVDIDFSKWDDFIRVVAVARAMPRGEEGGRFPSYQVDFCDVESFTWRSNHLGVELDEADQHCQLTIMDYSAKKTKAGYVFELRGIRPSPIIKIVCRRLDMSRIDNSVIDAVNPRWNEPYGPLARPGIEDLFADRKCRPQAR
jgi:hypothetical protein